MKKFFTRFFIVLGVIFFGLLLALAYLIIFDPLNIKPFLFPEPRPTPVSISNDSAVETKINNEANVGSGEVTETVDRNTNLTPGQENALILIGIDPSGIPTKITPEQEACFVGKLGQERVDEIKSGDSPTAVEVFTAKDCVQ